jgi:branched-subunit amino acid transport protein
MDVQTLWLIAALTGLTAVTVLTRCFFFISRGELVLPAWVQRGLRYAPLAALAAVVAPEVLLTQGELVATWQDARLFAVAASTLWFVFRGGVFGTIVVGMAVLLSLRLGAGW